MSISVSRTEFVGVAALPVAHSLFQSVNDLPRSLVESLGAVRLAVRKFYLHLCGRVPVAQRKPRVDAVSAHISITLVRLNMRLIKWTQI